MKIFLYGSPFRKRLFPKALLILLLFSACAPHRYIQNDAIERGHSLLGRSIADMVDRVDRLIGEPRVEDRQVKVKIVTGGNLTFLEGGALKTGAKVTGRVPLPSLERKANLYFDIEGDVESETNLSDPGLEGAEKTYQAKLQYLSLKTWPFSYGVNLGVNWDDGPQSTIKPFLRWEEKQDPYRYFISEEIFYKTDEKFGEKTHGHIDYVFEEKGFLRFLTEVTARLDVNGLDMRHAIYFRHPVGESGAFSYETGLTYNTSQSDTGQTYAQVRAVTRFLRPWLEFEVRPKATYSLSGPHLSEYSILVGMNVIFEEFLRQEQPQTLN